MPIICWGNQAKSANDTTRIEQAIDEYVERHNENPNAHMGADYALGAHRLQNVMDHPYSSIYPWHIYAINAHRITTGAMVVKGDGPYIVVQDSGGDERVRVYPEGIIVKKGRIVIESEDDQSIIDAKGLVGNNIFYSGMVKTSSDFRITGDWDFLNVPDMVHGMYVSRPTPCLIFGHFSIREYGMGANFEARCMYPTGYVPEGTSWMWSPTRAGLEWGQMSFTHMLTLYAGFNTIQIQVARSTPDSEIYVEGLNAQSFLGYAVLGN